MKNCKLQSGSSFAGHPVFPNVPKTKTTNNQNYQIQKLPNIKITNNKNNQLPKVPNYQESQKECQDKLKIAKLSSSW